MDANDPGQSDKQYEAMINQVEMMPSELLEVTVRLPLRFLTTHARLPPHY